MSNTSVVTPYEPSETTWQDAEAMVDLAAIFADTDEDRAADQLASEALGRQVAADFARRRRALPVLVISVNLHLPDAGSLLRSAPEAGYRMVRKLPRPKADLLILESTRGGRVVVEQARGGGVRLYTVGSRAPINDIMRRHTLDRALEHLRETGMQVATSTLANGEVQVLARGGSRAGQGELHAQIRRDGSSVLDVVGTRGPQCMEIVRGFAEATGGVIERTVKKDEYFTLPGEPRREKVRAR